MDQWVIDALKHFMPAPMAVRYVIHKLLSSSGHSPSPTFGWHCWMKTAYVELMQEKRKQAVVKRSMDYINKFLEAFDSKRKPEINWRLVAADCLEEVQVALSKLPPREQNRKKEEMDEAIRTVYRLESIAVLVKMIPALLSLPPVRIGFRNVDTFFCYVMFATMCCHARCDRSLKPLDGSDVVLSGEIKWEDGLDVRRFLHLWGVLKKGTSILVSVRLLYESSMPSALKTSSFAIVMLGGHLGVENPVLWAKFSSSGQIPIFVHHNNKKSVTHNHQENPLKIITINGRKMVQGAIVKRDDHGFLQIEPVPTCYGEVCITDAKMLLLATAFFSTPSSVTHFILLSGSEIPLLSVEEIEATIVALGQRSVFYGESLGITPEGFSHPIFQHHAACIIARCHVESIVELYLAKRSLLEEFWNKYAADNGYVRGDPKSQQNIAHPDEFTAATLLRESLGEDEFNKQCVTDSLVTQVFKKKNAEDRPHPYKMTVDSVLRGTNSRIQFPDVPITTMETDENGETKEVTTMYAVPTNLFALVKFCRIHKMAWSGGVVPTLFLRKVGAIDICYQERLFEIISQPLDDEKDADDDEEDVDKEPDEASSVLGKRQRKPSLRYSS